MKSLFLPITYYMKYQRDSTTGDTCAPPSYSLTEVDLNLVSVYNMLTEPGGWKELPRGPNPPAVYMSKESRAPGG